MALADVKCKTMSYFNLCFSFYPNLLDQLMDIDGDAHSSLSGSKFCYLLWQRGFELGKICLY
jgi:hypothetical protein